MVEGLALVEPAHLQHPVDCLAIAAESKLRTASHNRDKAEIKLRRERPLASISASSAALRSASVEKSRNGNFTARLTL